MAPPSLVGAVKQEKESPEARRAKSEANNPGAEDRANTDVRPRDNTDESSGRHDNHDGISGAGHGNFAPDPPRDQSSNAQAHSARHGVNKTRAPDQPATLVLSAELREYKTSQGTVRDLVDTSSGGGLEDDLLWNANKDQLSGPIGLPEDGARAVRLVQEQTGADLVLIRAEKSGDGRVIICAEPYRPDLIAADKKSQAPVKITSSDGTVRFSTNYEEYDPPLASQTTHASENPNVQCSSCGKPGHTLNNCLASSDTGFVGACILCNSSSHWTDGCAQFAKLSLSGKVKVLVTERVGKPPLATGKGWWDYLRLWYISEETRDEQAPTAFPWRQEFAARVNRGDFLGKYVEDFQSEFNQHGSSASPVDNEMQTLSDVFYRYWKGKETPVPSRVQAQIGRAPFNN